MGRIALLLLGGLIASATVAATPPARADGRSPTPYNVTLGKPRSDARFALSYRGSGTYQTVYHGEPPNKGAQHDTNDARDSSSQRWSLQFRDIVSIPVCAPAGSSVDPCRAVQPVRGAASGTTVLTAKVSHRHRDGLFRNLDSGVSCRLRLAVAHGALQPAPVQLQYTPGNQTISVTAGNPASTALADFPEACPQQGDSLDGLSDSYFAPGFSFAPGFGPDRWFAARTISIPTGVFHRASLITIPLGLTRLGRSPRNCAVRFPAYERCTTGGAWSGVLSLRAVP